MSYTSSVIDGSRRAINGAIWLDNTYQTFPDWIEVDFNGSKTISEIDVVTQQDANQNPVEPTLTQTFTLYGITAFDVQYWNGSTWLTVPNGGVTGNNKVWRQFSFSSITTSKIRVVVNAGADNVYSRVVEVEAWTGASGVNTANVNWLVTDQLGTPRMVFDQSGSLANVKRHDYLPFGEELFATTGGRTPQQGYSGGDGVRQQFTQKERDIETGLDYFNARYYASTQGRFTSPDPLVASGKAAIPQSWNRYTYCLNNPLKFIDPSGMIWVYHDIDKSHRWYSWFDGTEKQINQKLGKDYHAVKFGKSGSLTLSLAEGGTATLSSSSRFAEVTPAAALRQRDDSMPSEGMAVMREVGRRPFERATATFAAVGAAVGGGLAFAAPAAVAGSAPTTLAIESMTVTTSGAATDIAVLGSLENTAAYANVQGFNILRVADEVYTWGGVNVPWLNSIIQNGQSVLVKAGGSITAAEIKYLIEEGGYSRAGDMLLPPH